MAKLKAVIDLEGSTAVSKVLSALLDQFPGLGSGEHFAFSTLPETGGKAFYPTSGAVYLENRESITGHVKQTCLYPFTITYRAAPATEIQRMRIKEFLDLLGQWLERQPIVIGDKGYQWIEDYPSLGAGNRKIKSILATNASHLQAAYQDGVEDWVIGMQLQYTNEYDK